MKGKYLITTDNWFYAPDGKQYRAVWGEVKLLQTKEVLGVDPNRVTSNWTLQVGTDEDHILIGGCQINYSVKCPNRPNTKAVEQIIQGEKKVDEPAIYIPEPPAQKEVSKVTKETKIIGGGNKVTPALLNLINSLDPAIFPEKYCKWLLTSRVKMEGIESYNHYYNNSDKCYELYIKLKDGSVVIKIR